MALTLYKKSVPFSISKNGTYRLHKIFYTTGQESFDEHIISFAVVIVSIIIAILFGIVYIRKTHISFRTSKFSILCFGYITILVVVLYIVFKEQFLLDTSVSIIIRHLDILWYLNILVLSVRWVRSVWWYMRPVVEKPKLQPIKKINEMNLSGEVMAKINSNDFKIVDNYIIINGLIGSNNMLKDYRIPISQVGHIKYIYHYREKNTEPLPSIFNLIKKKIKKNK